LLYKAELASRQRFRFFGRKIRWPSNKERETERLPKCNSRACNLLRRFNFKSRPINLVKQLYFSQTKACIRKGILFI